MTANKGGSAASSMNEIRLKKKAAIAAPNSRPRPVAMFNAKTETSENAVNIQVWVAISVYVLAALLKKRLSLPHSLYTILQILSATLFENQPISRAFSRCSAETAKPDMQNQLCFQGFLTGQ